jgi:urea transport system permease protein
MMPFLRLLGLLCLVWAAPAHSQTLQALLQADPAAITDVSRRTIDATLNTLIESDLPQVQGFLQHWQNKELWVRKSDGLFFYVGAGDPPVLIDITTNEAVGTAAPSDLIQLKPNAGVRGVIASALVQFQLLDPDPARRAAALEAIGRAPSADQLVPLSASIGAETDPALRARKEQLVALLSARFAPTREARTAAIRALGGDISVEARAVLSQILTTHPAIGHVLPEGENIAAQLSPDGSLSVDEAYDMLAKAGLAPARIDAEAIRVALSKHIENGTVAGIPLAKLSDPEQRALAYAGLAAAGLAPVALTDAERAEVVAGQVIYLAYDEPDRAITDAAQAERLANQLKLGAMTTLDRALDGVSLASIYFLAAIGLAITFGVMGVINMAHGEFIMMGAYTGYAVQQVVPNYTLSLVVALPLAFAVTFAAGVVMERTVIRHLYKRPLETLLASFGISISLQQLAKNIFGTQARPLTSPAWLDGALVLNDVVSISYIRIAIFVLALLFLGLILYILKRTRLGLEVRAVTQNPAMAAAMGINPDRINMLTFGLGSGIAGIAGVAIGLYAKVTSEMGSDYIVQSFMTVVVGGVGNVWGALAGASMIGVLQKGIEWLNPGNTLAAQTYMILFIIVFIQFRPRGIIALKGRAAGD